MRVACVRIDNFTVAVEIAARPELSGRPVVTGGYPHERKMVAGCSDEAGRLGVVPGMPLRQAHHLCPQAVFLPADEARYTRVFEAVMETLDRFSSAVEPSEPGEAFLDITGSESLFGPEKKMARLIQKEVLERTGFRARIGIAGSKPLAEIAARQAPMESPLVVSDGEKEAFLGALPVDLLPLSPLATGWLGRLGLRTIGQLATLPVDGLVGQLGAEGFLAYRLAHGIDENPVTPRPRPAVLEETLEFEQPVDSIAGMVEAFGMLLDCLIPALRKRRQACAEVRLGFHFDSGASRREALFLKTPTDSKEEITRRINAHLDGARLPGNVTAVGLSLARLGREYGRQGSLATPDRVRQAEALQRAAGGLKAKFGRSPLLEVRLVDPDCRIPERRVALAETALES
jgi:DNA polymerase-4